MGLLNKTAILAADDLPTVDVPTPEWGEGGAVRLRMLTTSERVGWNIALRPDPEKPLNFANAHARLVALCAIGEDGKRLFTDAEATALGSKSGAVMARLFEAAREISKLGEVDIKEAEKNSAPGQSEDSSSALPGTSDAPSAS
jgi:hypothetical protein